MTTRSTAQRTRTSVSRHIPDPVKNDISRAYGGKRCAITRVSTLVEYSHVLPFANAVQTSSLTTAKSLGLLPLDVGIHSILNIVPLSKEVHGQFDAKIYPDEEALLTRIQMEEERLLYRESLISRGLQDPGRLSFQESYSRFYPVNRFRAFCGSGLFDPMIRVRNETNERIGVNFALNGRESEFPSLPSFQLWISTELLLLMRASDMTFVIPRTPEINNLIRLGMYLQELWFATPDNFRQSRVGVEDLLDPLSQPLLPSPQAPLQDPATTQSLEQTLTANPAPSVQESLSVAVNDYMSEEKSRLSGYDETRVRLWVMTTLPGQQTKKDAKINEFLPDTTEIEGDEDLSDAASNPDDQQYHPGPAEIEKELYLPDHSEQGVYRTTTANEHALVIDGVRLGGPVWNNRSPC